MAQCVNGGALEDAACQQGLTQDDLQTGSGGRPDGPRHTRRVTPAAGGKEPDGVAMGKPELAEQLQGAQRQRDIAVLASFAVAEVEELPGRIDVGDLQTGAFLEAQPVGVDGDQTNAVAEEADAAHDIANFLRA